MELSYQAGTGEDGVLARPAHCFDTGYGAYVVDLAEALGVAEICVEVVDQDHILVLLGLVVVGSTHNGCIAPGLTIVGNEVDAPVTLDAEPVDGELHGSGEVGDHVPGLQVGEDVGGIYTCAGVGGVLRVPELGLCVVCVNLVPRKRIGVDLCPTAGAVGTVAGFDTVVVGVGEGSTVGNIDPLVQVPVEFDVACDGGEVVELEVTVVLAIPEGGVGLELVGAAAYGHIGFGEVSKTGNLIDPVGVDIHCFCGRNGMHGSRKLAVGDAYIECGKPEGVLDGHVGDLEPFCGVGEADVGVSPLGNTALEVDGDLGCAGLAGLGSDDDDAVSGAGTVDCGSGGILHDLDRLDVVRVEHADDALLGFTVVGFIHSAALNGNSIHYPERVGVAREGTDTTDFDLLGSTGNTVGGVDLYTCGHTLKGGFEGYGIHLGDVVSLDGADGTDVIALLGSTVTDDDHVFKNLSVFLESDVDDALSCDGDFLGHISDDGVHENIVLGCFDGVGAVNFGSCSIEGTFDEHIRTGKGRACRIDYGTAYSFDCGRAPVLGRSLEGKKRHHSNHECRNDRLSQL